MYSVQLTHQAERDVIRLDPSVVASILDKIEWLALHADKVIHQRLKGDSVEQGIQAESEGLSSYISTG